MRRAEGQSPPGVTVCVLLVLATASPLLRAQSAPDPPKAWTIAASAGLALTSGNKNTSTINAAYDITYDSQRRHLVKSDGLLLRGKTDGALSANRVSFNVRDEYRINGHLFVFGQNQYLRDQFKNIDYLLAPTGGLGFRLIDSAATDLGIDASVGAVWEKNTGFDIRSSGAVTFGQRFTHALTSTTTLTESFSALWKTRDFDDALYTLGVSIAASMSTRTQLKVEALDTFKNRPPLATIQKNDIAVLMAVVYKM